MLPLARMLPMLALATAAAGTIVAAADDFHMKPVRSIQARVQGDAPSWDAEHGAFVSSYGKTFEDQYRASLDSVNTASVEGALMYVQAEGINQNEQSVKCERKNKMQYVVFYELTVVQPTNAVAKYSKPSQALPEYCPFAALDGGMCSPEGPNKLPIACEQLLGLNGQPNLGACVGAETRHTDPRAPYPETVWFSYPNSCLTKIWKDKTDQCRADQPGGLCPFGVQPDGKSCTYGYSILGYVSIDDVVGITSIPKKSDPSVMYSNFTEFCQDGNVEFKAKTNTQVEEALPFWMDPLNPDANVKRSKRLVNKYNKKIGDNMKPLPTVKELAASNPPCYENTPICASAPHGCRRKLFSQICEVCAEASPECVPKPVDFEFPALHIDEKFVMTPGEGTTTGSSSKSKHEPTPPSEARSNEDETAAAASADDNQLAEERVKDAGSGDDSENSNDDSTDSYGPRGGSASGLGSGNDDATIETPPPMTKKPVHSVNFADLEDNKPTPTVTHVTASPTVDPGINAKNKQGSGAGGSQYSFATVAALASATVLLVWV